MRGGEAVNRALSTCGGCQDLHGFIIWGILRCKVFFSFSWNIITHCTDIRNKIVFVALWVSRDRTKDLKLERPFLFPQVIRTLQSSLLIKHWTKDIWLNLFKCKRRSDKDVESSRPAVGRPAFLGLRQQTHVQWDLNHEYCLHHSNRFVLQQKSNVFLTTTLVGFCIKRGNFSKLVKEMERKGKRFLIKVLKSQYQQY